MMLSSLVFEFGFSRTANSPSASRKEDEQAGFKKILAAYFEMIM